MKDPDVSVRRVPRRDWEKNVEQDIAALAHFPLHVSAGSDWPIYRILCACDPPGHELSGVPPEESVWK